MCKNAFCKVIDQMEMETVLNIGNRRELFVDHVLIDRLENTHLTLHKPISAGTAIVMDRPWEEIQYPITVIWHCNRYIMYYGTTRRGDDDYVMCVAISDDSVTWSKPVLSLVERSGHRDTNVTVNKAGKPFYGITWYDTRPGIPENERIKAVTTHVLSGEKHTARRDPNTPKCIVLWASADGFTFRKVVPQPEFVSSLNNSFDGGISMFWSEAEQAYVFYYRFWDTDSKGGVIPGAEDKFGRGYRSVARTTSKDMLKWTDPVPMTFDTPREQFYTNQTEPYFRAPHIYVAPAARFMEGRRALSDAQVKAAGLKRDPFFERDLEWLLHDCSDGVLLTSRAGATKYDRTFMEAFVRPGIGAGNWVSRTNYPFTGILPCGVDHMMFFVNRHYTLESWYVERLLLRLDGFASVTAPWAGGEMVTKPFIFSGQELEINYRTSAAGSIRVEIQDSDGTPVQGYALDDCPEIIGDEIERTVIWKQGPGVHQLSGRPVRLRFTMKDADLFALQFRTGSLSEVE
ncbi:MAG: hypothetical protein FIA99_17765 [Ruminiclostridium sp.]|nr:hypothetical protein [Ruminiclostridium sp.]